MSKPAALLGPAGRSVIALGGALPGIATGTISVMLPGISDAFAHANGGLLVKMVVTTAGLGMMFGAPLGGVLADRVGRRAVLAWAVALFAGLGILAAFTTALWQLIAARFGIGLASGAMTATYVALIADSFPEEEQSKWVGINAAVAVVVVVFLNPIVGALADIGWRYGFLVYAAALPILFLALVGIPREGSMPSAAATGEPKRGASLPWRTLVLAVIGGTLATGTVLYWPFRLREVGVTSARDLALLYLPNVVLLAASAFAYGRVRRSLSVTQVFATCGFLSAAGLVMMAFASSPAQVVAGLMVEGIGVGLMTPNLSVFAISIAPAHARARTIGLMKGAFYGSPFLTQFPLEWLNRSRGTAAALLGIAVIAGSLGVYMAALSRMGSSRRSVRLG